MYSEIHKSEVLADLAQVGGNKIKLVEKYANRQIQILAQYGGNFNDLPIDPENEYYKIQAKMQMLGII